MALVVAFMVFALGYQIASIVLKDGRIFEQVAIVEGNITQIRGICCIPDDCIDPKRYPLFMARAVMRSVIERIKAKAARGATSC